MKQQTSLEVLIITGAIAMLILSAIAQYGKVMGESKPIQGMSYPNYSIPNSPVYYQRPYVLVSIPAYSSASSQNYASIAAYGCNNGTVTVAINSSGISFSTGNFSSSFYNAAQWTDQFVPSPGIDRATARYSVMCIGQQKYNGTYELNTIYLRQGNQNQYSAYISNRNEAISYKIENQSITSVTSSEHCTSESWTYVIYPILFQCGTYDAWEYAVSSSTCSSNGGPLTATTCVYPSQSGYGLSSLGPGESYSYSINLTIVNGGTFNSRLSSSNAISPIYYNGNLVGNATVESVSSQQPPPGSALLSGKASGFVNSTNLDEYDAALSNLDGVLGYYNSSLVSSDTASRIQQTVSSYSYYENKLTSTSSNATHENCKASSGVLYCNATYPFYYLINATISNGYMHGNITISYAGSTIKVHN